MKELFFELIRVATGRQGCLSRTPSAEEWAQMFAIAEKHALVGVCYGGLLKLGSQELRPPLELLYQWIGAAQQIVERNKVVNRQCLTLQRRLQKDGFRSCILKGQGNARLYKNEKHNSDTPLSLLRQSGDIDVWVKGGFDRVLRYVQGISPTEEVNEQHVHLDVFRDTEVEVHFTPSRLANRWLDRRLQRWFTMETDRQIQHTVKFGDGTITVPTTDFNLVYQLLHIYRHLFSEGIGLRQLMDYYVLLTASSLTHDECDYVRQQVHRFGLDRFAAAVMWILGRVFGMEETMMLWKPDKRCGQFLLNEVMQMGNFGHGDERFRLSSEDSHLKRYWQMVKSKWRFVSYFPSETLWQPIDTLIRFFELKRLKRRARKLKNQTI